MRDQTRAEAQQRADRIFQVLDANHDGIVTRAEAEQAASQFAARRGGGEGANGRMERLIDREFGTAQSLTLQQFEAQVALALLHFIAAGVEVAVLETGLGGRLDATNVVPQPLA